MTVTAAPAAAARSARSAVRPARVTATPPTLSRDPRCGWALFDPGSVRLLTPHDTRGCRGHRGSTARR